MTRPRCVLDSSVALAWVLPGERTQAVEGLLDAVAADGALAPGLWPLEVANVLLQAERARRLAPGERGRALAALGTLPIAIDAETPARAWGETVALAEAHGLTCYDAAYLEVAARAGLPLATLDRRLARAAAERGVALAP